MRLPPEVLRAMDRVADDAEAASMESVADLLSELRRFDKRLRAILAEIDTESTFYVEMAKIMSGRR